MPTALWLQPPPRDVPWEHRCRSSGEEGVRALIFPARTQGPLSEGGKGLCWAHRRTRGPYGCGKTRRVCHRRWLGRGRGTGSTVTARSPSRAPASPTDRKSNKKSCEKRSAPSAWDVLAAVAGADRDSSPSSLFSLCPKQKKRDFSNKGDRAPQPPNAALWTSDRGQKARFSTELADGVLMG